jgi:ArsR family transcriptional regulator, arsenate/arsenite/antimonite-responsive transcriptional repressor
MVFEMANSEDIDLELFFSALADRTRLRLLNLMRDGEVCVCFFAETLKTNNPKISRHLAYLKKAQLVSARRDGKWVHYQISEPRDAGHLELFRGLMKVLDQDPQMQADKKELTNVCCSTPSALVSIAGRSVGKDGNGA